MAWYLSVPYGGVPTAPPFGSFSEGSLTASVEGAIGIENLYSVFMMDL